MNSNRNYKRTLTAADVMSRVPVTVHHRMPLRGAGRVLAFCGHHVLPVTDEQGRFVGTLTAADVLRWALDGSTGGGQWCYDTSAWTDWQMMAPGAGRTDEVRWYMVPDPFAVTADTSLADLAQEMRERRACCAVVIDDQQQPVGVVSGGHFLAADDSQPHPKERVARPAVSSCGQPSRRTPAPVA